VKNHTLLFLVTLAVLPLAVATANTVHPDRSTICFDGVVDSNGVESAVMEVVVTVSDPVGVFADRSSMSFPRAKYDPMVVGGNALAAGIPLGSVDPSRSFDRMSRRAARLVVLGSEGDAVVLRMLGTNRRATGPTVFCRRRVAGPDATSADATGFAAPQSEPVDLVPVEFTYAVGTATIDGDVADGDAQEARRFTPSGATHELRMTADNRVEGNSAVEIWLGGGASEWSTVESGVYDGDVVLMVALNQ